MTRRSKLNLVSESKIPTTKANYIGIEFEFISDLAQDKIAALIVDQGLERLVNLGSDGSIEVNPDYNYYETLDEDYYGNEGYYDDNDEWIDKETLPRPYAYEARLLTKEKDLLVNLRKMQVVFDKCGATINQSCGLHVHLDMRQRKPMSALGNLIDNQSLMRRLVASHRRNDNEFCEEIDPTEAFADLAENLYGSGHSGEKYRDINVSCYNRLKTFEIRIHHASIDMKEVYNWVSFLTHTVDGKPLPVGLKKYVRSAKKRWA